MSRTLRIGEYASLGTLPYFYPLRRLFNEPEWTFVPGRPDELGQALSRRDVDVALVSPSALANSYLDYVIFPDLGYAGHGHVKDVLLFSDILLDDMDEMTLSVQDGSITAGSLVRIMLGRYLQYQNEFILGWGKADAYVLCGDAALRERLLGRYAYVYDVGDLWRHYTGKAMIYYLWAVRKDALREKQNLIARFHRLLQQALEVSKSDWSRLMSLAEGYEWMKKPMFAQLWNQVEYELKPEHFEGLHRFFDDCIEIGLIDEPPELEYFEHD